MNTSTLSHGHRRQISTPSTEAARQPNMSAIGPRRTHRRGQTVDYGRFGPQPAPLDRRSVTNKVAQLRDFFNEKSGQSRAAAATQKFAAVQDQQRFMSAAISSGPPPQPSDQYQSAYMWSLEEVPDMYTAAGNPVTFPAQIAPALARSASDNTNPNATSTTAIHRMRGEQANPVQGRGQNNWDVFSQQAQSMQPLSIHSDNISPKMNTYLSYTSPLTPDATPMKTSFDLSMYPNDQTPSKPQSFSFPHTPGTTEMQRAQSLQGVPGPSVMHMNHQMPSPANSVADFAELAAMPSPRSRTVSPQKPNLPSTPSASHRLDRSMSSSSPEDALDTNAGNANDVDLDARVKASLKESAVSGDEIAQYISGPDAKDNKWVCLYSGCHCRFGRKENIKSHVQTHLNDRQYVCDRCGKDFVRGHDLKRHLKTHSGNKPFACACGASFARQDALTRHRQRDMCIGGFTGFVPKTTKRGRPPKKNRPDIETRQAKSTRTRQRAAEKAMSISPVKIESSISQEMPVLQSPNYAPSSAMSSFTPPASPGGRFDNISSPSQSGPSITSQQFEDDMLPVPLSPPQLAHNRYARAMESFATQTSGESSQDYLYSDPALSPYDMSSPHTAPTLAESTVGSEIDVFMTQESTDQLKEEFDSLTNQTFTQLPPSYAYVDTSDFGFTSSIYGDVPGKSLSGLGPLDLDPYSDPIESFSSEFLVDP